LTAEVARRTSSSRKSFRLTAARPGIGIVGALGALGSSLAAILFRSCNPTSWGWRGST
jgi:hypothetical protein